MLPLLAAALAAPIPPQGEEDPVRAGLERLLTGREEGPACAVGILRDGDVGPWRAVGSRAGERPTPGTTFYLASTSKQFTAFAVLLLDERGALALTDGVRAHVPELPALHDGVQLRHLLSHTGGLRDHTMLLQYAGRSAEELGRDGLLALIARQEGRLFAPGADFAYCNTGYWLLALVVERASGRAFDVFLGEEVFAPLEMRATSVAPGELLAGAGGVRSTLADLARWERNLADGRVGGPRAVARLVLPAALDDGTPTGEAWGLVFGVHRGRPVQHHAGHARGANAQLLRFPGEGFAVAALADAPASEIDADALCRAAADLVLGVAPEGSAAEPAAVSAGDAEALSGIYVLGDDVFEVRAEDGRLQLRWSGRRPRALAPAGDGRFRVAGRPWTIEFDLASEPRALYLETDGRPGREVFAAPAAPPPAERAALAGRYRSAELDVVYAVRCEDAGLFVELEGDGRAAPFARALLRLGPRRYTDGSDTFLEFDAGPAPALRLRDPRVGSLTFTRLP